MTTTREPTLVLGLGRSGVAAARLPAGKAPDAGGGPSCRRPLAFVNLPGSLARTAGFKFRASVSQER